MKIIKIFILLICIIFGTGGCMKEMEGNKKTLNEDKVITNMKLYLLDKYGTEYEVENITRITEGSDYTDWFVAKASKGEEEFYVRVDIYNKNFRDSKYLETWKEELQEYVQREAKNIWKNVKCETGMKFLYYTPEQKWGENTSVFSMLQSENPLIYVKLIVEQEKIHRKEENEKIQKFLRKNKEQYISAYYEIQFLNEKKENIGKYEINILKEDEIPSVQKIGEYYNGK